MTSKLLVLLQQQSNPLGPLMTFLGFIIAMIILFYRWNKKDKKDENKMQ